MAEPQPGQPISLRTLGEYLNLSPATISLVLNNAPGVRSIPQETRDRVIEAAAKFDYRPSFFARSLRKRQTFTVGVLVPELSDNYATEVLAGVEEFLIEEGYFYLTASHRRKPDLIEEYPRLLMDRSVEGFILIDTILEKSLSLPVVVGRRTSQNRGSNQRRARSAARRRAGVAPSLSARPSQNCVHARRQSQLRRRRSMGMPDGRGTRLEASRSTGADRPTSSYAFPHRSWDSSLPMNCSSAEPNSLQSFATTTFRPSAPFALVVDHGLQVPADISVVGFDDIQGAAFHNPSLTTIRQPLTQMGKVAARILLQRIRGQATFPDVVPIRPELVIRESTCPPNPKARPLQAELNSMHIGRPASPGRTLGPLHPVFPAYRSSARNRRPTAAVPCRGHFI